MPLVNSSIPGGSRTSDLIIKPAGLFAVRETLADQWSDGGSSLATAPATFQSDALAIMFLFTRKGTTAHDAPTKVTSAGRTWELIADDGQSTGHLSAWVSHSSLPTSGVITADFGAETIESAGWSVVEIYGARADNPIVQSDMIVSTTTTTITNTLSPLESNESLVIGCVTLAGAPATIVEDTDYVGLTRTEITGTAGEMLAGYAVGETTRTTTWSVAKFNISILMEIGR